MSNTSYKPTSLLPAVYPKEEHALDIANAKRMEQLRLEMQTIKTLANPRTCPIEFLPLLAYSLGSDFYWELEDLSKAEQREMIANSLQLHRRKGTRWAVEKVLSVLGVDTEITEWWEEKEDPLSINPTEPYTFNVVLDVVNFHNNSECVLSEKEQRRLLKYLDVYKNVRSDFDMYLKVNSENGISLPMVADITDIDTEILESDDFAKQSENKVSFASTSAIRDSEIRELKSSDYSSESKAGVSVATSIQQTDIQIEKFESIDFGQDTENELSYTSISDMKDTAVVNLETKNSNQEVVNEMEIAMNVTITEVYDG